MRMHRPVSVVVAALSLVVMTGVPSWADPPAPSAYLALGDSVAAGVGAVPPAENGYVPKLYDTLLAARSCGSGQALGCRLALDNIAVGGATTTSLIATQLPAAISLLEARNGDPTPIDDINLVTLDIGGNDVFGPVISACAPNPAAPICVSTIFTQLHQVDANYDVILSGLRAAAGPETTIAVMTYYNPLPACRLAALAPLAQLVLEGGGPLPAGLNDIIRSQAAAHGAVVVETAPVIGLDDLVGGSDCLHPDNSGHAAIAGAFASAIDVDAIVGPPGRR
jgi:lysophospholipase L1-like esterase